MGRVTLSFRMRFKEELHKLRRYFKPVLIDPAHRDALDSLERPWSGEVAAMGESRIVATLDAMNLMGIVDNRKLILHLKEGIEDLKTEIKKLEKLVEPVVGRGR